MATKTKITQQIAVFGESGSGKTVLLSSFFGTTRERSTEDDSLFDIVANDTGQSKLLLKNYYGMKNSATTPPASRRKSTSYDFTLKVKPVVKSGTKQKSSIDALGIRWHDYPGDWFETSPSGPEDARRRVETFRNLLECDVALLLVDAQKLAEHSGEEERYLKSLFANINNTLLSMRTELLAGSDALVSFPRIWMFTLSKADLIPSMTAADFEALVIEKSAEDIVELRNTLASMVEGSKALDVGEDFITLSSAKFETGFIDMASRKGVDLLVPVASILPFERHVRWAEHLELPAKVADNLLRQASELGAILTLVATGINYIKLPGALGLVKNAIFQHGGPAIVNAAAELVGEELAKLHRQAVDKKQIMTAILSGFKISLEAGEKEGVLVRSKQ